MAIQCQYDLEYNNPYTYGVKFKWRFAGVPLKVQHWMLAWQLCDFSGDPD